MCISAYHHSLVKNHRRAWQRRYIFGVLPSSQERASSEAKDRCDLEAPYPGFTRKTSSMLRAEDPILPEKRVRYVCERNDDLHGALREISIALEMAEKQAAGRCSRSPGCPLGAPDGLRSLREGFCLHCNWYLHQGKRRSLTTRAGSHWRQSFSGIMYVETF